MFSIFFIESSIVEANTLFSDIEGHWAEKIIYEMVNKGITEGYSDGSYKPNHPITRAEYTTLIVRAFHLNLKNGKIFKDTETHWAKEAIATAQYFGIVKGYSNSIFQPDALISREQMAAMIMNTIKVEAQQEEIAFIDRMDISDWAKDAVVKATNAELIGGYSDGTFKPKEKASRAEAIAILSKAIKMQFTQYYQKGIYGPENETQTIEGDVIISADGVILQNIVIEGNLIIAEEVGDGDVTLKDVTVKGTTFIRGGGEDSIHVDDGQYNNIIIEQTASENIRIVATNVDGLQVIISEEAAGEKIILEGSFNNVEVNADNVDLSTKGHTTIETIKINENIKGTILNIPKNTNINKLILDSETTINNAKGTVKVISGNAAKQSSVTNHPTRTNHSSSGGSGGSTTEKISDIRITGDTLVGRTLTAVTVPSEATVKYQWKSSDTVDGVYSDIEGADESAYTLTPDDADRHIEVTVTGTGSYTGTKTSEATAEVLPAVIDISLIPGITVPVTGGTPVNTITETDQYTGTVTWNPEDNPFETGTVYTANILLTEKAGYILNGVLSNFFSVEGAVTRNTADSGAVTAVFPETATAGHEVTFTITDGTDPINGAEITIDSQTLTTDSSGIVTIDLEDGSYTYCVTAAGYDTITNGEVTVAGSAVAEEVIMSAAAVPDKVINIAEIPGVIAPVTGGTPVDTITETDQYTGTVTWSPAHNPFKAATAYTAHISLTAKAGYTLTGVSENFFKVVGADTVTHVADFVEITAEFPETASLPIMITSINPNSGPAAGGNTVTITGANLTGVTSVTFGSIQATSFAIVSDAEITATVPTAAAGDVNIIVATPAGSSNPLSYTYVPMPKITAIGPNSGPLSGWPITITGTEFIINGTLVTLNGADVAVAPDSSETEITVMLPAHAAGSVNVTVTVKTIGGTATLEKTFSYIDILPPQAPTITSINPSSGPESGGTTLTITGTNLNNSIVFFGGNPVVPNTSSDTELTLTAPAGTGAVTVTVSTPGGTSNSVTYTYVSE